MTERKGNQGNQSTKKPKKKKKKHKAIKIILLSFLSLAIFLTVVAGGLTLAIIKTAPELDLATILTSNEASKIYDDKGEYVDSIITEKKRVIIKYDDMPENLVNAFVSIEDERFFDHKGIDLRRIAGVILADIKSKIKGKGMLQGGSTITQQLLKTTLYEFQGESFEQKVRRKIQEWYLAPQLEKKVDKEIILEAYLNTVFLGGRAIGVEAAAQQYFGVSVKDLTLTQCAFLAGVNQSPSIYYPYSNTSRKDPSRYLNRTKTVLFTMKDNGYITEEEYSKAIADLNTEKSKVTSNKEIQTLGTSILGKASSNGDKYNYEWFSREVVSEVKEDLKAAYNYSDDEIENLLVNGGLKIYSTMDKSLQDNSQKFIDEDPKLKRLSKPGEKNVTQPQASAVLVDYHTGEVKVIIGGRGEQPPSSFNRAMDAKVPPGSSIKPLTVYSPAVDMKLANAATVIEDSPLPEDMAKKYATDGKPWQPENSNGRYSGYLNMRNAIKDSVNVYAVKLEDTIGLETGFSYGEKYGIKFDDADKHSIAALALGQMNTGTNTFTMANAYGVFGNNGLYTTPRLYTKVVDRSGKLLLESKIETKKVLSPQAAFIMYDMLKEPVRGGTAYNANNSYKSNIPLAGKTGSSTNFKNLWFCGLTPYYSGAVWIENKNSQGIYSSDAAYILGKIMDQAVKNLPVKDIAAPSGITSAAVDRVSGLLPTELSYKDPRGSQVYTELFIKDTVPTATDNIHVEAKINKNTGKLASLYTPSDITISKVFLKRDYTPTVTLGDQAYVLPKDFDDTVPNNSKGDDDINDEDIDENMDEDTAESIGDDDDDLDDSNLQNSNNGNNKNKNNKSNNILDLFD